MMTRKEAVAKAVGRVVAESDTMCVIRRGQEYRVVSSKIDTRGWKVAEMIGPGNVQNFKEASC